MPLDSPGRITASRAARMIAAATTSERDGIGGAHAEQLTCEQRGERRGRERAGREIREHRAQSLAGDQLDDVHAGRTSAMRSPMSRVLRATNKPDLIRRFQDWSDGNEYVTIVRYLFSRISTKQDRALRGLVSKARCRSSGESHGSAAPVGAGKLLERQRHRAGVFEYRIDFGPGYRMYFGKDGDAVVILLGGGTKKRQDRDMAMAHDRWLDYKKRTAGEVTCR